MSGQVQQIRPTEGEALQAGVDAGFQTELGEGRVLTLRTTFFQGTAVEEQAKILRSLLSIADKEKANYELVGLRWQMLLKERGLRRAEEDVARLDSKKSVQESEIDIEIGELTAEIGRTEDKQRDAWSKSGRGSAFIASAPQKQAIAGLKNAITRLEEKKRDLHAQIGNERRDTLTALAREKTDVNTLKEEIERRLMILGLPSEM